MQKIIKPLHPGNYPDRALDCEAAVKASLRDLVDGASNAGWSTSEILATIERVTPSVRIDYEENRGPSDDPIR